jgi:hypothetical protein
MSLPLVINGVTYNYPQVDDLDWGPDATDWAAAVTAGMLQKSGGLFQLLAEVDFGTAYGVKSLYLKSRTANPADAGQIRFARADVMNWRNQANDGNLSLGVSSSNILQFNGVNIQNSLSVSDTSTIDLTFVADVLSAAIINDSITNAMINSAAAIAYSKLNLSGSIVNADVNAAAAIAYSKLNLTGSIVNADVNAAAAIAYSKLNLTGSIVNADVNAAAAIAYSKLATLTSGNILVGNGSNVATSVAMSGDVTISNAGVTAIGANKVLNSMLNQMAQSTIKGRAAGAGTGDPVDLTATQATAILNNMVGDSGAGGTKGLVPAPAAGDSAAGKFLKADGTWVAPSGAGDVVGPGASTDNGFVRFDGTTGKLIKNSAATIVNADVSASAAIAYSKLNLSASIVNADISGSAAIAASKLVGTDIATVGTITTGTWSATTVAVNKGGTGQTSYTDGQLLIGNTTGNTLAKATLTAGANISITNGNGSISIAASSTSIPAWTYVSQSSTLNPAVAGRYYVLSGASFNVTLPAASGVTAGQGFYFEHGGTSLTQVYTFLTTGGDTIGGIASGSYAFYTAGEAFYLISNGADGYRIAERKTATTQVSVGSINFSADRAYVISWTGNKSIVQGDTYTDGTNTYTVSTTANTTSGNFSGTGAPAASGTLTLVTGTGLASIVYTSRTTTGQPIAGTTNVTNNLSYSRNGKFARLRFATCLGYGRNSGRRILHILFTHRDADRYDFCNSLFVNRKPERSRKNISFRAAFFRLLGNHRISGH